MGRRKPAEQGYTIVEMVTVIAIITILMSLIIPTVQRATRYATAVSCINNLKAIYIGIVQYSSQYEDFLPAVGSPGKPGKFRPWYRVVEPYVGQWEVYRCPGKYIDTEDIDRVEPAQPGEGDEGPAPATDTSKKKAMVHYGMNATIYKSNQDIKPMFWDRTCQFQDFRAPAKTILVCDTGRVSEADDEDPLSWEEDNKSVEDGACHFPGGTGWGGGWRPVPRHDGKVNVLFAAGGAERLPIQEVVSLTYVDPYCLFDNQ